MNAPRTLWQTLRDDVIHLLRLQRAAAVRAVIGFVALEGVANALGLIALYLLVPIVRTAGGAQEPRIAYVLPWSQTGDASFALPWWAPFLVLLIAAMFAAVARRAEFSLIRVGADAYSARLAHLVASASPSGSSVDAHQALLEPRDRGRRLGRRAHDQVTVEPRSSLEAHSSRATQRLESNGDDGEHRRMLAEPLERRMLRRAESVEASAGMGFRWVVMMVVDAARLGGVIVALSLSAPAALPVAVLALLAALTATVVVAGQGAVEANDDGGGRGRGRVESVIRMRVSLADTQTVFGIVAPATLLAILILDRVGVRFAVDAAHLVFLSAIVTVGARSLGGVVQAALRLVRRSELHRGLVAAVQVGDLLAVRRCVELASSDGPDGADEDAGEA